MNFIVSSKTLLHELQLANGVIVNNSPVPILADFLFSVQNNQLTITASDTETIITTTISVESKADGEIAIPAKKLIDSLKTFGDIPLTFSVDATTKGITISSSNGKYNLVGDDPTEYPRIAEIESAGSLTAESLTLAYAINTTISATATDVLRPVMSGVLFEMNEGYANFVATDAHKLVKYTRKDIKASNPGSIILPKKPLNILKNILGSTDETVTIDYNDKNVRFSFKNITITGRLIDGKFPNYEAVIPKNNPNKLTVDRSMLINALERARVFANQSSRQVRFRIAGSDLQITSEDTDFSSKAHEQMPCQYDGDDLEIGFNADYVLEMLKILDGENVVFELSEPSRAGTISPVEYDQEVEEIVMLVMPIMLPN